MVGISDADQDRLSVPGFHFGRAVGVGFSALPGPGAARRNERNTGMAVVLFQGPDDSAGPISRTRSLYPADEIEEYSPVDARRRPHYPSWTRILRLIPGVFFV